MLAFSFRKIHIVKIFSYRYCDSAEKIEINLIVYGRFFTKNKATHNKPCDKVIERSMTSCSLENKTGQFVQKNKASQLFTVLPSIFKDTPNSFGGEFFKEKDHYEGMNESNPTAVFESVSEPFEKGQDISRYARHSLI